MKAKFTGFIYVEAIYLFICYIICRSLPLVTIQQNTDFYRKMIQDYKLVSKFLKKKNYKFQKIWFAKVSTFYESRFLALFEVSGFSKKCLFINYEVCTIHHSKFYFSGLSKSLYFSCTTLHMHYFVGRFFYSVKKQWSLPTSPLSWFTNIILSSSVVMFGISILHTIMLRINSPSFKHSFE